MINHLDCPKCNNSLFFDFSSNWHLCIKCEDLEVSYIFKENKITDYTLFFNFNSIDYWCEITIRPSGLYNYCLYNGPNDGSLIINTEINLSQINSLYYLSLKYINNLVFL